MILGWGAGRPWRPAGALAVDQVAGAGRQMPPGQVPHGLTAVVVGAVMVNAVVQQVHRLAAMVAARPDPRRARQPPQPLEGRDAAIGLSATGTVTSGRCGRRGRWDGGPWPGQRIRLVSAGAALLPQADRVARDCLGHLDKGRGGASAGTAKGASCSPKTNLAQEARRGPQASPLARPLRRRRATLAARRCGSRRHGVPWRRAGMAAAPWVSSVFSVKSISFQAFLEFLLRRSRN